MTNNPIQEKQQPAQEKDLPHPLVAGKGWSRRDTLVAIIAAVLTTVVDQLHNIASLFN